MPRGQGDRVLVDVWVRWERERERESEISYLG